MSKDAKMLRGQLRQIAKELLPELLSKEFMDIIRNELRQEILIKLSAIDERSKDIQAYMIRQSAPVIPNPLEPKKD